MNAISRRWWTSVPSRNCTVHGLVVLVQKDRSLQFCTDLRKLNNQTFKDAYSLPHINETLDSLQESQWFSSLDLKSGYGQAKMDEESKPLITFTMGPLGFYKGNRMPSGLTNNLVTFQWFMETCLMDLNLNLVYHLLR